MASDISITTWTGIASCALSCGCWLGAASQGSQAKQLGNARTSQLSDLKDLLPLLPLLVAVRGKAWTDQPIRCETDDQQQAVFAEIREVERTRRKDDTGAWREHDTPLRQTVKSPDWYVRDGSAKVQVREACKADYLYLAEIGHIWTDPPGSTLGKAVDLLTGFQVVGRKKMEKALPVGTGVTVVGELANITLAAQSRSSTRPDLVLQKPRNGGPFVISNKPFRDVIAEYRENSDALRFASIAFGVVGVALLGAKAAAFGWRKWRERRVRDRVRRVEERRAAARLAGRQSGIGHAEAAEPDAAGEGGNTCVICLERACDTVFSSCGHMCTCSQCSTSLIRCPICRTKTRPIRVYRP